MPDSNPAELKNIPLAIVETAATIGALVDLTARFVIVFEKQQKQLEALTARVQHLEAALAAAGQTPAIAEPVRP